MKIHKHIIEFTVEYILLSGIWKKELFQFYTFGFNCNFKLGLVNCLKLHGKVGYKYFNKSINILLKIARLALFS